jgi:RHS repeat-associated protein
MIQRRLKYSLVLAFLMAASLFWQGRAEAYQYISCEAPGGGCGNGCRNYACFDSILRDNGYTDTMGTLDVENATGDLEIKASNEHGNTCSGDPVYLHSGQFFYQCNEVNIPGRKLDLELNHTYFSGLVFNGPFGYGWMINYYMRLHTLRDGGAVIVSGDGRKVRYTYSAGSYVPPAGRFDTLVKNGDNTYTLTLAHGEKYQFATDGKLTAIQDRNGNTITLTYDSTKHSWQSRAKYGQDPDAEITIGSDWRLDQVTDTGGRDLDLSYNADGLLESIEDGSREWLFGYDAGTHDLLTITKPATAQFTSGVTKTFEYENHNVKKIKDAKNNYFVENTYDGSGRVTAQKLGSTSDETMTFNYSVANQVTEYDRNGFQKIYVFNAAGNMTSKIDYTNLNLRAGEPNDFTTVYTYNSDSLVTSVKYPRGNGIKYTYDSSNSNRRARGNLLEARRKTSLVAADNNTNDLVTTMTYETSFNHIDTLTDPKGNVTAYTYDHELSGGDPKYGTVGDLIKITYPTVAAGTPEMEFTYNAHGQITEVEDPNGNITQYSYNATTGYLETITRDPAGINAVTTLSYDANGYLDVVLDPNGKDTDYDYDELGWLNQVTDPLEYVTKYTYDANGNVTKIEKQASATPTWQTTDFTYTRLNHIATVTDPLSRVTTYAYDDNENLKTVTDNNSKVTNYVYDERNLLFTVTDDNAGVTRYDYDINGKLAKVIDAETNDTEYAYDLFDRLTETKYVDNSTETYSYDKNSNLYVLTRPSAATITHTYDALNRLTAKDYGDSTPDITYSYDLGSRMLAADNSVSLIDFTYDDLDRIESDTQYLNSSYRVLGYVYDDGGRRERLTYPSTKIVNYTYDDNNRLDLVKIGVTTLADYDYDVLNRRAQKTLSYPATDQAAVYTFDIGNQLTNIINKVLPSTNIATYAYTDFDAVGNREEMQRTYLNGSAASTNYTYNDLYELSGTSGVQSHSYAYDKVGNRTTVDSVNYTDNTRNQYTAVGGTNYTNSTNGNITSDGTSTFGYDAENRLVSFDTTGSSNDATYAYDALGRRVKKTVNSTSTFFVYDGDDIIADYSSAGTLLREYIHGDKVDEILAMQAGTNTYYYHYDGLGSVTEITDDTGSIIENYTYDPFGAPSVTTSTINNRYRFTGREYDEESGLYHYRARAYSPTIGRFMQRDPIGYYDGMNLYRYVDSVGKLNLETNLYGYTANDPINRIDPLGLYWLEDLSNFSAGFGDTITFGGTAWLREQGGYNDVVNPCSGYYKGGEYSAYGADLAIGGAGAGKVGTKLFARRVGLLNKNDYLRIGWGWKGNSKTGYEVFRIGIGKYKSEFHKHIDLFRK